MMDAYIIRQDPTRLRLNTLSRVGVETNNPIVYLTGEVETSEQKSRVGSLASQVNGVKRVVNNLQVIKH